jgi:WD40 repeat protein
MPLPTRTSYDDVPHESLPFSLTHLERLGLVLKWLPIVAQAIILLGGAIACTPSATDEHARNKPKKEPIATGDQKESDPKNNMAKPSNSADQFPQGTPKGDPTTPSTAKAKVFTNPRYTDLAFLPNGKHLLALAPFGTVLWDVETGKMIRFIEKANGAFFALSKDGTCFLTVDGLWDIATGDLIRPIRDVPNQPKAKVKSLALSANKRFALMGGVASDNLLKGEPAAGAIQLWDLEKGEIVRRVDGGNLSVAISSDARFALTCGYNTIQHWDLGNGHLTRTFDYVAATKVCFSDDDKFLIFLSSKYKKWSAATGDLVWDMASPSKSGNPLAFTLDRRFYLTNEQEDGDIDNGRLCLWDVSASKIVSCVSERRRYFSFRFAIAPDNKTVAIGGTYPFLEVSDLESDRLIMALRPVLPDHIQIKRP